MIACYTDRLSARPGERVTLHASSSDADCTVEIARVGRERVVVDSFAVAVGDHPTPEDADRNGCRWPAACEITIGADWVSGYYDIALRSASGEVWHHFVCVMPAKGAPKAKLALVLATNTYQAYNWWGGASAYSHVTKLMTGQLDFFAAMEEASGRLSTQRPFIQLIIATPEDAPRLINMRKRGMKEQPWAADMAWMMSHHCSPYDGSAGFVNKWENRFVEWAEENGYALDYYTDYDLDAEQDVLEQYSGALFVGHSEYWSGPERAQVERFVDNGGKIAIFSGNTCFWKVRWEDDGATMINHKWRATEAEPDATPESLTGLWLHPMLKKPEAELTGLSFVYAGYHRLGMCVSRGQAGYTIYNDRHWALEDTDLFYGDVIGDEVPLLGYENDGCRFTFDERGMPQPVAALGVPENLQIIGVAPCAFGEESGRGYAPIIPPERLDVIADVMFGDSSPEAQDRVLRGHAVMASFERGKGEVFNCGATEWAHGLKDPFLAKITRNVLDRFQG